ncbi:MAG: TolC family protein [Acidobacteriota bacterium]|jgi:cobalt-zinc-cadmium efflux system outer membrane protein|nr:TolC family protein [Acidobacteriota bacterium]
MRIPRRQPARFALLWIAFHALSALSSLGQTESPPTIPPEHSLSVNQLVERALDRNGEIRAASQRDLEARALVRQAGLRPNPSIDFSAGVGDATGSAGEREFSIEYSHTIELGGKRKRRVAVAESNSMLAASELRDSERNLAADVRLGSAVALAARQKLQNVEELQRLLRRNLELAQARAEAGETAPLEQNLLHVELNRIDAERILRSGQLEQALLLVKRLADIPLHENLRLSDSLEPEAVSPDISAILDQAADVAGGAEVALLRRPDLNAFEAKVKIADAALTLETSRKIPDLVVRGGYTHTQSRFDQFGFATPGGALVPLRDKDNILFGGVSIAIPLSDRNQGNIAAAANRGRAASYEYNAMRQTVRQEVLTAWSRAHSTRQALQVFKTGVLELSQENLRVIRAAYELGELRLLDVIAEQRRLLEIENEHVDLMKEAYVAMIELERAIGAPLEMAKDSSHD